MLVSGEIDQSALTQKLAKNYHGLQCYSQSRWQGGRSSRRPHSQLMGVLRIVPGKVMEWPGTVRPAAL